MQTSVLFRLAFLLSHESKDLMPAAELSNLAETGLSLSSSLMIWQNRSNLPTSIPRKNNGVDSNGFIGIVVLIVSGR